MRTWFFGFLLCLVSAGALAQDVPPALRDWQGWVVHDFPQHVCPFLTGSQPSSKTRRCLWPGRLHVQADAHAGRFRVQVEVDAPAWLPLPGGNHHWPLQVTDRGRSIAVHDRQGVPMVRLDTGKHVLAGQWTWKARPSSLVVPDVYGMVDLTLGNRAVPAPRREGGRLHLGRVKAVAGKADALSLQVFRLLQDGLPPALTTRLELAVSGRAREVVLGPVLPASFVATRIDTALPARLDKDGRLHVQLRAGRWQLVVHARGTKVLDKLAFTLPGKPWPDSEVWTYNDDPGLRQTRAEGRAVDAAQAGVPAGWRSMPAFAVGRGQGLSIHAGLRAGQGGVGDKVRVQRQMWLGFDGQAYVVRDRVVGRVEHPRRLAVASPWKLDNASVQGKPLLVSQGPEKGRGVELRQQHFVLDAGLQVPSHAWSGLPVSGWQLPLERLDVTLHLPYGQELLGVTGADRSNDSWVASWTLLDLFLVALIAILCGRLLGWSTAVLAGLYLMLAHDQAYAPYLTVLIAAALALLARVLPQGRLHRVARFAALGFALLVVLWSLPFAATQLRDALYPQLEMNQTAHMQIQHEMLAGLKAVQPKAAPPAAPPPAVMERSDMAVSSLSSPEKSVTVSFVPPPPDLQYNPGPVQAGPGVPDWSGKVYRFGWSGPVTGKQSMHLWVAPAWLVRVLRVLSVLALALLLLRLFKRQGPSGLGRWRKPVEAGASALLLLALVATPGMVHAQQTPSPALLKQLQQRLLKAPACAPQCAMLTKAQLRTTDSRLHLLLQAQVEAPVAVPLPSHGADSQLASVRVDGKPVPVRRENGRRWVSLPRGVHSIEMDWRVLGDDLQLNFGQLKPKHVTVHADGWVITGLQGSRLAGDTLHLQRKAAQTGGDDSKGLSTSQDFPAYVRLTRSLNIGTDWHVHNTVQRLAPAQAGFSVRLPLLAGEHPLGSDVQVHDGAITITFKAGQQRASWQSRIEPFAKMSLKAPALDVRSERWQIKTTPAWHVEAKGVPPQPGKDLLGFAPLPGEALQLRISKPLPVPGNSVAVDHAQLVMQVGEQSREHRLHLDLRSTRGGEVSVHVPEASKLLKVTRDKQNLPSAISKGQVSLPLRPGSHDYVLHLRQAQDSGMLIRTPAVAVDAPLANIELDLRLPSDRWVLWTWGPQNGPAVLYWPQLLVLLLVAVGLARFAPTPLKRRHWILLGLGFSTFAWSAFAFVAAWLILLGLRERSRRVPSLSPIGFNLLQAGLAVVTLVAIVVLVSVVPRGLLGQPDMHISGNGSTAGHLRWMLDRSHGELPRAGVLSLPLWCYKLVILAWALWLANALVGWLRWAFAAWSTGGYWRHRRKTAARVASEGEGDKHSDG